MRLHRFLAVVFAQSVTVLFGGGVVWASSNEVKLDMKLKTKEGVTHSKLKTEFGKATSFKNEKGNTKFMIEVTPQRGPLQSKDELQVIKLDVKISEVMKNGKTRLLAKPTATVEEDRHTAINYKAGEPDGLELTIEPSL